MKQRFIETDDLADEVTPKIKAPPNYDPQYILVRRKIIKGSVAYVYGFRPDSYSRAYITFFIFMDDYMWQRATRTEVADLLIEIEEQQQGK